MSLVEFRLYDEEGNYKVLSIKEYNDLPEWQRGMVKSEPTAAGYIFILLFAIAVGIGVMLIPAATLIPLAFVVLCICGALKIFR